MKLCASDCEVNWRVDLYTVIKSAHKTLFQNQYVYLQIKNKFPTSSKTISNFHTPVVFKTTIIGENGVIMKNTSWNTFGEMKESAKKLCETVPTLMSSFCSFCTLSLYIWMSPEFVCSVCLSAAVIAKGARNLLPIMHYMYYPLYRLL